ncbi:MAG TPA: lipopolysaccharide biosynthesis protein [Myxococcota bacterium]|nr:lipopolysaccharide biosynthesis protein [Myxococcales bacterium]HPG27105.1 lipopolysaccharide biosynthesis protein [Myxococcota bacterium]
MSTTTEYGADEPRVAATTGGRGEETLRVALALAVSAGLTFVFTALSTRLLGARDGADFLAGVFALSFVVTAAGPLGGTVARSSAIQRALGTSHEAVGLHRAVARMAAAASAIAAGLLFVAFGFLREPGAIDPAPLAFRATMAATGALLVGLTVLRGLLRGLARFRAFNEGLLLESGVRLLSGLVLVALLRTASAGVVGYLLGGSAALLVGWRRVAPSIPRASRAREGAESTLAFVAPMMVMALAHATGQNLDVLVVRGFAAPEEAAAYGVAAVLAQLGTLVLTPFGTTLLPRAAALHARDDASPGDWNGLLLHHVGWYVAATLPLVVVFGSGGTWLVSAIFGPEFAQGGRLLLPVTLSIVLGGCAMLVTQCLAAEGRFGFLVPYCAGPLAAFAWILVRTPSPYEVAWSLCVAKIVTCAFLLAIFARRERNVRPSTASVAGSRADDLGPQASGTGRTGMDA